MGNLYDDEALTEARRAQEDPWVMYLVVRSDVARSASEVLLAAAEATVRCADALMELPEHRDAFREWSARSFRKVSVRAKGKHWERLASEYPCGEGAARGEPLVRALVPRRRSENDSFLKGLQVYNPEASTLEPSVATSVVRDEAMAFVLNPAIAMSLGKAVAQVGHAVLMSAWSDAANSDSLRERYARWRAEGYPCAMLAPSEWARAKAARGAVVVRDAGLTEVAAGSETVCAVPPGEWAR